MEISPDQFRQVSELVQHNFGIHLPESKRAMMSCRLFKVVRETGCNSFGEYFSRHLRQPSQETLSKLANALSTNHTYFNRESSHFWYLRDRVLPGLIRQQDRAGKRDLRVWCAAASTGEEPYTLAMIIRDALGADVDRWKAGLLATDISMQALSTARRGVYPREGAQELPKELYQKYFHDIDGDRAEVDATLRGDVTFRRFNLINERYPFRQPFHVVFCRNVMIYFEEDTKKQVVENIYRHTAPGGYLFVGHAESINGLGTRFRAVAPGVYRRD
jgi:chemotaxis protein methyltransferase CheR